MRSFYSILFVCTLCASSPLTEGATASEDSTTAALLKERVPPPDWKIILNERVEEGLEFPDFPAAWTPSEDASAWKQVTYWQRARAGSPGPLAREKMLQSALIQPTLLPGLLEFLPQTETAGELVAAKLDGLPQDTPEQRKQLAAVRAWVFLQTGLFREAVLEDARNVDWRDFRWEETSPAFDALLDRDPEAAWTILREFVSGDDPALAVVGNLLLWQSGNAEEDWRKNLMAAAGESALPDEVRKIASSALLRDESKLRQAWMIDAINSAPEIDFRGFSDVVWEDPDRWTPVLAGLAESNNPLARARAAALLVNSRRHQTRADALEPLLPWLTNSDWAREVDPGRTRLRLIHQIRRVELPAAIDGLEKLLESNEDLSLRATAASTLSHYGAKEAVPPMKILLREEGSSARDRDQVLRAVHELEGYSPSERVDFIEEFLVEKQRSEGEIGDDFFLEFHSARKGNPGHLFIADFLRIPDDELFAAIQARSMSLRETDPALSDVFQQLLRYSRTGSSPPFLVECLQDGSVSARQLGNALRAATEDDWDGSPFDELASEPGEVGGWAAVLSRDDRKAANILESGDAKAQAAVLAAARITGDSLPLETAGSLLRSEYPLAHKAAKAYLQSRHDPEANLVYKAFASENESSPVNGPLGFLTSRIHHAFKTPPVAAFRRFGLDENPREIYALLSAGGWGSRRQRYLLVYPGEVVAVRADGGERLGVARVSQAQFDEIEAFIADYRIDELPPYHSRMHDGTVYEYIHATDTAAWRVFMNNPPEDGWPIKRYFEKYPSHRPVLLYTGLVRAFKDLFRELNFEMGYGNDVPILIPREHQRVQTVWKEGDDLRILVENPDKVLLWLRVDPRSGAIIGPAEEPAGLEYLAAEADIPEGFRYSKYHSGYPWRIRAGNAFVRSGTYLEKRGLWLTRRGEEPELLSEGLFMGEVVSSDGKWCAVAKALGTSWATPNIVVLINLETHETTTVDLPPADTFKVVTYLPEKERFLLVRFCDKGKDRPEDCPEDPEYYTLAPETGQLKKVSGEFRPLSPRSSRRLQKVSDSSLYWAAISGMLDEGRTGTQVGHYDREEFRFQPLVEIPGLYFKSDQMWVDEEGGKVFAAIGRDLTKIELNTEEPLQVQ